MSSKSPRRSRACLGLALCLACSLSLLPCPAAAVGLQDLAKTGTEQTAPAEPEGGLWTTLWSYFAELVGIVSPPRPTDGTLPGAGEAQEEDQGVTLDPNG